MSNSQLTTPFSGRTTKGIPMSRTSHTRATIARAAALGAAAGLGALALASPASAAKASKHLAVDCPPPFSQTCEPRDGVSVTNTQPRMIINFVADPNPPACAPGLVTFYVDGQPDRPSRVDPGQTAWLVKPNMPPGTHQVDAQMTGVLGGCNTGAMSGWSGTLNVETDADATNDKSAPGAS
jgi:hypothetical protein